MSQDGDGDLGRAARPDGKADRRVDARELVGVQSVVAEPRETPGVGLAAAQRADIEGGRSEEHTSELQSLMRISYAVFCLQKKRTPNYQSIPYQHEDIHSHT